MRILLFVILAALIYKPELSRGSGWPMEFHCTASEESFPNLEYVHTRLGSLEIKWKDQDAFILVSKMSQLSNSRLWSSGKFSMAVSLKPSDFFGFDQSYYNGTLSFKAEVDKSLEASMDGNVYIPMWCEVR